MNMTKEIIYTSPSIEVVNIETEQCILAGSVENIGKRKEEIDW